MSFSFFSFQDQHSPTSLRLAVAPAVKTRVYSSELAPRKARMEDLASETFSELRPPECGFPISVDVSSLDTASTWLALYRVEAAWSRYVRSVTC